MQGGSPNGRASELQEAQHSRYLRNGRLFRPQKISTLPEDILFFVFRICLRIFSFLSSIVEESMSIPKNKIFCVGTRVDFW